MDIRLALMTGTDIPVPSCQLTVHQPTIKEIGMIGEKDFFIGAQCLSIEKTMYIQDESRVPNEKYSELRQWQTEKCGCRVTGSLFPTSVFREIYKEVLLFLAHIQNGAGRW